MNKCIALFLIFGLFLSCTNEVRISDDIAKQSVDMDVVRFDKKFASSDATSLPALQKEFPYLFPNSYEKSYWVERLSDTIQLEINQEVKKAFPDVKSEQSDLEDLFKHITFYYPNVTVPTIITLASDPDYRNKFALRDSLLVINLSNYLGSEHHFYTGIPKFQSKNFRREQIDVDVAEAFVTAVTSRPQDNAFLSEMMYEGKKLYAMRAMLTLEEEHEVLGYTADELEFARENEREIWQFFIKNELLYSTDRKLLSRFLNPAPFSKFYLAFDNETPGRVARFIGYEMVTSYMDKNDVPLKTMLNQDAATIFAAAKYKP